MKNKELILLKKELIQKLKLKPNRKGIIVIGCEDGKWYSFDEIILATIKLIDDKLEEIKK